MDDSIKLAPHLRTLLLGFNQISGWENLDDLSELCTLELASNKLEEARDLHLKLASQIARLDLSDNKVLLEHNDLQGFFLGAYQGHSTPVGTRKIEFLHSQIEFLHFFH